MLQTIRKRLLNGGADTTMPILALLAEKYPALLCSTLTGPWVGKICNGSLVYTTQILTPSGLSKQVENKVGTFTLNTPRKASSPPTK